MTAFSQDKHLFYYEFYEHARFNKHNENHANYQVNR